MAGCGGGGGSGDTTVAAPAVSDGAAAAGAGAPTGTAVITAAAANPAVTNTAANPNQAFGLIVAAGASPVMVQSPPVVNFTVIDSTGKFVPGLTLVNPAGSAAGLAADPNCSGNNVTLAMAKLNVPTDASPSTWQNLISRQRLAANGGGKFAVVEGTTDPKPTASTTITDATGKKTTGQFANPATAVTDPTTRIVGILEEDAAGGYYTYRFATDVVTPLLMADAVDVKNVSQGKVANNGNVAVKDGKTIHRVGAQLCYTDPATKAKVVVNPYFDFTLDANGSAVAVKGSDGKTPAAYKQVVDKASCNECHETLTAHGTRVDPNYCVLCHNPGSTDYNTNNPIDLKLMIHRIHMGVELTKDFKVNSFVAKATDATTGAVTGVKYSQDQKNCVKCHDGSATATHQTAQGDNWMNVPSRNACGACHDGIDFATGKGTTLADANSGAATSVGHVGGAKKDDTQCVLCHDAATIPVYHATVYTAPTTTGLTGAQTAAQKSLPPGAAKIAYEISSVTVAGTPKRATVVFRILKDGAAVTFNAFAKGGTVLMNNFTGGPSIYLVFAVPQDGITAPADFNASYNASVQNIWDGTKGTLTGPDAGGNYTAVLGDATTAYDIPENAVMVTGALGYGSFKQTNVTGYSAGLTLPAQAVQKVATGYSARRTIVATANCNTCHEQLGVSPNFHSGARNDATACAFCHTPNRTSSGWSADSTVFIHGIHGKSKRTVPYTWAAVSTTDSFADVEYPGVLKNCETCHVAGSYDFSASASASALPNRLYRTAATGIFNGTAGTLTAARTFDANGMANNGGSTSLTPVAATSVFSLSPYVTKNNAFDYGLGFSYSSYRAAASAKTATATSMALPAVIAAAEVIHVADATTLVNSPIAAACFSCHDTELAKAHMTSNGGSIYAARTGALAKTEQCTLCHLAGKVADIKAMHAK